MAIPNPGFLGQIVTIFAYKKLRRNLKNTGLTFQISPEFFTRKYGQHLPQKLCHRVQNSTNICLKFSIF